MSFSGELRKENKSLWEVILGHPFIKELGQGELPLEKFAYYVKQDYLYLEEFARCLGLAASKAGDIDSMRVWAEIMSGCLKYETLVLESLASKLEIPPREIEEIEISPTNRAYTNHLLKISYSGTLGEILAALLPCMWTYQEIGEEVNRFKVPRIHPVYSEWCQAYITPEYTDLVKTYIDALERYTMEAGEGQKRLMRNHFKQSLKYEYMFWVMAYQMEEWPHPKDK
jgi:thiaminase/transcriptional activator TenA